MYEQQFDVDKNHIDFHNIVDGLYIPFYFEWTRHAFMRDVVGVDLEEAAKSGYQYVLSEYTLKFKRPVKLEDKLTVTCEAYQNSDKPSRFNFKQTMLVNGKVHAEADFSATCIMPNGRPGVPDEVKRILEAQETSV